MTYMVLQWLQNDVHILYVVHVRECMRTFSRLGLGLGNGNGKPKVHDAEECVCSWLWVSSLNASLALPSSTQHSKNKGPASTALMDVVLAPPMSLPFSGIVVEAVWRFGSEGIHAWGCYSLSAYIGRSSIPGASVELTPIGA